MVFLNAAEKENEKKSKKYFPFFGSIVLLQYNDEFMGRTKAEMYTEDQNKIAMWAKVLGHPARVGILQHLFRINSCICGDLVEEIGLAQPTISQHLKELKNLGLIRGTVEGTSVCYCINPEKWNEMKAGIAEFLNQDTTSPNCC